MSINSVKTTTHWWKKYQNIKEVLKPFIKDNNLSSVEEAIELLLEEREDHKDIIENYNKNVKPFIQSGKKKIKI